MRHRGGLREAIGGRGEEGEEGLAWVTTGESVSALYWELRGEAEEHAECRHRCFTEASHAYLSGKKSEAKALSRQGQAHGETMEALHAWAAEETYARRNAGLSGAGGELVDLHGLHPKEGAEAALRRLRQRQAGRGGGGWSTC